jgi:hypothetical protein
MRQAIAPWIELGSGWLDRREIGSLGSQLRRLAYGPGRDPVRIDDLISPLRYDILIRQSYFEFLREHRPLADSDFEAFVERSRSLPFFEWFERIAIPRFHPAWGGDPETVRASFEGRLRKVIAMYDDLEAGGYDPKRPIVLRTADEILPTTTGKRVATRIYAGDGCHRLAWLRFKGVTELEPGSYRLASPRRWSPHDITALVLREMTVKPSDYFRFVSLAYADRVYASEDALLEHVGRASPQRLQELRDLIATDRPLLATEQVA